MGDEIYAMELAGMFTSFARLIVTTKPDRFLSLGFTSATFPITYPFIFTSLFLDKGPRSLNTVYIFLLRWKSDLPLRKIKPSTPRQITTMVNTPNLVSLLTFIQNRFGNKLPIFSK